MNHPVVRLTLVLAVLAAVWTVTARLSPRDPDAQPDTALLRHLPPLSVVQAVRLVDGSLRYADEIGVADDGSVEIRRGDAWSTVPADRLAQATAGAWRTSERYWLGTDEFGRDVLSRLLHGSRISLAVGFLAAAMAVLFGSLVGLAAGLGGRALDGVLMRATDLVLSFPKLFLLLLLVSIRGPSPLVAVAVIGATTWMATARVVRGEVLSLRKRGFVEAARAGGAGPVRLAFRHLAPALVPALAAEAALRVGQAILLESSLSFLGLVVSPPTATWGNMVAEGRSRLHDAWWVATFPGVAIAVTVLTVHAAGERIRRRAGPGGTVAA